jgi:hypothetical protein
MVSTEWDGSHVVDGRSWCFDGLQTGHYSDKTDWRLPMKMRFIPTTRAYCLLNLVVGALLIVSSGWALASTSVRVPALEIIVILAAAAMMVCAVIGLVSPRMRGR